MDNMKHNDGENIEELKRLWIPALGKSMICGA